MLTAGKQPFRFRCGVRSAEFDAGGGGGAETRTCCSTPPRSDAGRLPPAAARLTATTAASAWAAAAALALPKCWCGFHRASCFALSSGSSQASGTSPERTNSV